MFHLVRSVLVAFFLILVPSFANAGELININKADATVIADNLSGIGQSKAVAIVEYRKANGKFTSIDELTKVKGIGAKLLDRNRTLISLTTGVSATTASASPTESKAKPVQPAAAAGS